MKSKKKIIILSITLVIVILFILIVYIQYDGSTIGTIYKTQDINSEELVLAYRYRSSAWGFSDYVYLISADGSVKYVDIASDIGKELSIDERESFHVLDDYMKNPNIPTLYTTEKISDSNLNEIINIQNVKLKRNGENANDAGFIAYYCITGTKDERKMVCIEESGDAPRVSRNQNIKKLRNIIQDIIIEANRKKM